MPPLSSEKSSPTCSDGEDLSISSGPEDDLDGLNPRKKRRVSPPGEVLRWSATQTPIATMSRIRPRQPESDHATRESMSAKLKSTTSKRERDSFENINVQPWLVASLASMAITRPTGIQKACIPEILKGRDCIGGSRTGSGKTMAFAVPILQRWAEDPIGIFALVLTPTRFVQSLPKTYRPADYYAENSLFRYSNNSKRFHLRSLSNQY
jgi:ATP-dependent RNA helicase DDX49/DBP8